jgi:sigma-B regulation protein RsbU (phosphoserine phosphatase)
MTSTALATPVNEFEKHILSSPIMIVDDNEINRIFLEKTLKTRGFTKLLSVNSGEEALQKLSWFQTEMVILDIMMPDGMDGFECCEAIRAQKRYQDLPVLIQTTITDPELKVKAFSKGATDFVSKPIYPDELVARVMVHLEKRFSLETLQMYKKRVAIELESARQLQQYILPRVEDIAEIERKCGLDIAAYYQPCSEVGGDFWSLNQLFPNQTAFWLVDFSGHGVASALNAFRLQAYMKDHTSLTARPGEYLAHLNDKLLHLLMRGQFATMFYGIVDTQSNQLFYACACAPHPIILRRATKEAEMVDGSGVPLGIGMHLYQTQIIPFAAGDVLMLYSDALTETQNDRGEYLTEESVMALLQQHQGAPANKLKDIVLERFREHAGNTLNDDLTIVIVVRKEG